MLYHKINKNSAEALPSGLDLFSVPFTQVAVEKTYEREFLTLNPKNDPPFNFRVLTGSAYLIPNRTRVVTRWRLQKLEYDTTLKKLKDTPENVSSDDNIVPINGLGATFMENLKVLLQGQEIFHSNFLYSQYAYLENLLHFPEESKKSSMSAYGWYHENKGKTNAPKTDGWQARRDLFVGGKTVEFSAPLYADFFQQPLFLLNNMELDFEIRPRDPRFLVNAPKEFKGAVILTMESIRLYCTFADLHPGVSLEIEKRLESEPARYLMNRVALKSTYFEGARNEASHTAFTDYIPDELYISFTTKKAYDGDLHHDGQNLIHMNMHRISTIAGNMEIPYVPFDMDFADHRYIRGYEHLHRTLGNTFLNGKFINL